MYQGSLGIITEVTLRCVPAFNLHAVESVEPLVDVVADFDAVMHSTDHVEFYLMPGARRCQVKRNTVTDAPSAPQSKVGYIRDKWIGENLAFGTVCRVGRRFPSMAPKVAKLMAKELGYDEAWETKAVEAFNALARNYVLSPTWRDDLEWSLTEL